MSKYQPLLKLFTVLLLGTTFIFSTSHFGSEAIGKLTNADGLYSTGTTIGTVDVTGKSENEATALLEEKYIDWINNTTFELQYSEKIAKFDVNLFQFDATSTVLSIKDGQSNPVVLTLDFMQLEAEIQSQFPEIDSTEIALDKLTKDLSEKASNFETGIYNISLNRDYLLAVNEETSVSEVFVELEGVSDELYNFIKDNSEITIAEESNFSLLEFAKAQKIEHSSALSIIATGIYQAILPTNLSIVERNISAALPIYANLGFEAMVNVSKGADLVIVNPNQTAYKLVFDLAPGSLKVTLKGDKLLYKYEVSKKDEQVLKPKTIIQYSPLVLPGQTKVQTEGTDGKIVKIYRDIYQGGQLLKSDMISEDYYPPVYRVELHGLTGTTQNGQETSGGTTTTEKGTQTPSTSNSEQQDSNNDDLWGKTNEQPK